MITPIGKSKIYLLCHLYPIRIKKLTQTIQIFQPVHHDITHETLTYIPTDNPSTNVHVNQQSISDINTQRKELDKGMHIANNLKRKLNS